MPSKIFKLPSHFSQFMSNLDHVNELVAIHEKLSGNSAGRRRDTNSLNRAAIVMLCASWESFVEALAVAGFEAILNKAETPQVFPKRILNSAIKTRKEANDGIELWDIAGDGWKSVLKSNKEAVYEKYVAKLNTPREAQINGLFKEMIGLTGISSSWYWKGSSKDRVIERLELFVTLRGDIAHGRDINGYVKKKTVEDNWHFVHRLAGLSSNRVRTHVHNITGEYPWDSLTYTGRKPGG